MGQVHLMSEKKGKEAEQAIHQNGAVFNQI